MSNTPGIAGEAVDFLREVTEAETENRREALEDLKFRFGEQWPTNIITARSIAGAERPMFTINETDSYCRQVINQMRQQRPRGRVHPVNSTSDVKIAEVINGIGRHIEVNSDADNSYDLAGEFQITCGVGYWRILTDYTREDSFEQDIYVRSIENPFSVYFDPFSTLADGSDSEKVLITDIIRKEIFKKQYPGQDEAQWNQRASGDSGNEWLTKDGIRVAEYYRIQKTKKKLVKLSTGTVIWEDKLPDNEILAAAGVQIVGDRMSWRKEVKWSKVTSFAELDSRTLPGRYIPIVPVYGINVIIDSKRKRFGMVRFARDPQQLINFWQTAVTESIALAPKAKWVVAEGQIEGHENEWRQANNTAFPYLTYNQVDVAGKPAPQPQRQQPEPPPAGAIEASMLASQNLQRVLGMFDPVNLKHTGPKSGEAIRQEMGQSEQSNYHFYDNLTRSIRHTWRIFLDLVPQVYDTQRVMRVIGEDGKPDLVTINEKKLQDGVQSVLNDVTVGEYDVVMDTGPGFNTKRQEAVAVMTDLMSGPLGKVVAEVGADLVVRNIDAPGMEQLADRLAAANPLSQIDEKSDVPPQAQLLIKHLQDQLQKAQQALQQASLEMKYKGGIEQMKEQFETKRELMRQTGEAHEREVTRAQKQHDTETYALTAQNVAEINGLVKLLTSKTEHGQRLREMLLEFEHETKLQDRQLESKSAQEETVQ